MLLSIRYRPNRTSHADLVVRFGTYRWDCDSYYLRLDSSSKEESPRKVRRVLRALLEQWAVLVREAKKDPVFLPFDFSDEYTRWVRCVPNGERFTVCVGFTPAVSGWAILPSDVIPFGRAALPGFEVRTHERKSTREALLAEFEREHRATQRAR